MGCPALTPASLPPSPESSKTEADLTEGWWRIQPVPRALPSQGSLAVSAAADTSLLDRLVLELQCRALSLAGWAPRRTPSSHHNTHTVERDWFSSLLHNPGGTPQGDLVSVCLGPLGLKMGDIPWAAEPAPLLGSEPQQRQVGRAEKWVSWRTWIENLTQVRSWKRKTSNSEILICEMKNKGEWEVEGNKYRRLKREKLLEIKIAQNAVTLHL